MNRLMKNAMASSVLALALGLPPTPLALAAHLAPEEQAFKGHTELPDTLLDGTRGSFISADQILYFGVEMYTQWHTASGDTYGASLNIGIDRSANKVRPTVTVVSNVNGPNGSNGNGTVGSSSRQPSGGGLNQVQGVSQVVQTTGNRNGISNNIGIDVTSRRPAMTGSSNPALADGNRTYVDKQTGATAQTYVNRNGAGVNISVPMQGTASQSVASMIGMQQRAQVFGDTNNVQNQLNMVIQVQPNSTANGLNMGDLLQTVRGR